MLTRTRNWPVGNVRSLPGARPEPGKLIVLATVAQRADERSKQLNVAIDGRVEQHEDAAVADVGVIGRLFGSLGHRFPDREFCPPAAAAAGEAPRQRPS
jgi:hypothetical protein